MRLDLVLAAAGVCVLHSMQANAADLPSESLVADYARQVLAENYPASGPGAAVLIAREDRVLFRGARGLADVQRGTKIAPDSLFCIASVTKQFVAASILTLAEAGKLSLTDPLSKHLRDYPGGDKITIAQLLNHTSGVANYTGLPQLAQTTLAPSQLIDAFKSEPPAFAPGTGWAYDNSGYVLLGAVIESATQMSWFAYVEKTFLRPLGMNHTGFLGDPLVAAQEVHGYTLVNGKPVDTGAVHRTQPYADGALVSDVDDLLRWNLALHEGKALKASSYQAMITPAGSAAPELYGYGIRHNTLHGHTMLAHSGHVAGFSAFLLYLPETRTSVVILQNMDPDASLADTPTTARRLAAFAIGEPYAKPRAVSVSAGRLAADQGVFGADPPGPRLVSLHGARILRVIDGRMTIARVGDERKPLLPTGPDSFQSQNGLDRIELERSAGGKVIALRFFPDGERPGLRLVRNGGSTGRQIALPKAALRRVAGTYVTDGVEVRVFMQAGKLLATVNGQLPAATLLPESPDDFVLAEVDGSATFSHEAAPRAMTLKQGSMEVSLKRKQDEGRK